MSIETLKRHKGIFQKALCTEAGQDMLALLRESFVDVNLLGKDDRETVANVAQHDLVIYMIDMGKPDV